MGHRPTGTVRRDLAGLSTASSGSARNTGRHSQTTILTRVAVAPTQLPPVEGRVFSDLRFPAVNGIDDSTRSSAESPPCFA